MSENVKITRGWPPSRRKKQAARIRKARPCAKATGPKTQAGKARSSQNARKHGLRSAAMADVCRLMRLQRAYVKAYVAYRLSGVAEKALSKAVISNTAKPLGEAVEKSPVLKRGDSSGLRPF